MSSLEDQPLKNVHLVNANWSFSNLYRALLISDLPVITGRSVVGFNLGLGLSLSLDLDLLYERLCLSRSRSRSLSLSLDFTRSRSTDLKLFEVHFPIFMPFNFNEKKIIPSSSFARASPSAISISFTFPISISGPISSSSR